MSKHWPHRSRCPECGIKQGDINPTIQPCHLSQRIAELEAELHSTKRQGSTEAWEALCRLERDGVKRIAELEEKLDDKQFDDDHLAFLRKRIAKLESALGEALDDMPPITTRDRLRAVLKDKEVGG